MVEPERITSVNVFILQINFVTINKEHTKRMYIHIFITYLPYYHIKRNYFMGFLFFFFFFFVYSDSLVQFYISAILLIILFCFYLFFLKNKK